MRSHIRGLFGQETPRAACARVPWPAFVARGILLLAALAAAGCDDAYIHVEGHFGGVETTLTISADSGEECEEFPAGSPVGLALQVTNHSREARAFPSPSAQSYDFAVLDRAGIEVWRWSADQVFPQVPGGFTLGPGESATFTTTWDQRDNARRPVPAGHYEAKGFAPADSEGCVSDFCAFRIR